jgi:ArsR family transcriptional regulator, arsenate/arsenite/antimonite-responsive transcriptional repressor
MVALDTAWYFEYCQTMEIAKLSEQSLADIAAAFAALGQPSRLQIVRLLLSAYPKGLPAGEIQKELNISAPTLSHHLDKLRQVGIVTPEKDRQWIWYSVRSEALKELMAFLFEECCTRNHVVEMNDVAESPPLDCCD